MICLDERNGYLIETIEKLWRWRCWAIVYLSDGTLAAPLLLQLLLLRGWLMLGRLSRWWLLIMLLFLGRRRIRILVHFFVSLDLTATFQRLLHLLGGDVNIVELLEIRQSSKDDFAITVKNVGEAVRLLPNDLIQCFSWMTHFGPALSQQGFSSNQRFFKFLRAWKRSRGKSWETKFFFYHYALRHWRTKTRFFFRFKFRQFLIQFNIKYLEHFQMNKPPFGTFPKRYRSSEILTRHIYQR